MEWLERWYQRQCNGHWEHQEGVSIQSVDNPGWMVAISLRGTKSEARATDQLLVSRGEVPCPDNGNVGGDSWLECRIRDKKFVGVGDPLRLGEILAVFRMWIEDDAGTAGGGL